MLSNHKKNLLITWDHGVKDLSGHPPFYQRKPFLISFNVSTLRDSFPIPSSIEDSETDLTIYVLGSVLSALYLTE